MTAVRTKIIDIPPPHYRWPHVDDGLEQAVRRQLHRSLSDYDASGVIGEFERAFAEFAGVKHAIAFSSGTAAIHAMSRAAGLKPGDAILAPGYTFLATATPFAYEGVEVRFVDVDGYGNATAANLAARLAPNVRAVIITHMWGNPCALDEIAAFCHTHGLLLLEDCSHAHFASWAGRRVGTLADMAAFSTGSKAISTGEGGVLVTRHDRYRDLALLFGHYNNRPRAEIDPAAECYPFAYTGMGLKYRMTTLGAAIGVHQLGQAAEIERRRRGILARFRTAFAGNPVITPLIVPSARGEHGLYVVGLRFNAEHATVSRAEFIALCHSAGAVAIDAPPGTRNLSREPLFARRDRYASWRPDGVPAPPLDLPGVTRFEQTFIRTPIWGYPGDDAMVDGYIAVLTAVSEAAAR